MKRGSPPRMRGKARGLARPSSSMGITPAYAGKRIIICPTGCPGGDHPRVCGEKAAYLRAVWVPKGSPPRMRGKAANPVLALILGGITPAYAGKRARQARTCRFRRDHPRVCGEKYTDGNQPTLNRGSPPRMRGKAKQNRVGALERRITPAYAGKSSAHWQYRTSRRDHPRVCGEKTKKIP